MKPIALAFAAVVPSIVATAQEAGRYLPRDAMLYAHCDAPAALRDSFAQTDLAALLESRDMKDLFESASAMFETLMGGAGDPPPQLERLGELFAGLEGRLRLALRIDAPGPDEDEPRVFLAMELAGTDAETLEEMEGLFAEISELQDDETIDFTIAGETFRGIARNTGEAVLLPKLLGSSLVLYMGHGVEESVAAILGRELGAVPDGLDESPLAMRMDLEAFLETLTPFLEQQEDLPIAADRLWEVFRVDGMRDMVLMARPEGARARFDLSIGVDPARATLLDLVRPEQGGQPRLLALVPRQHRSWSVGHFRPDALYDWVGELLVAFGAPLDMAGLEEMFEEQFKVRLKDDLLAHWGDEVLSLSSTEPVEADAEDFGAVLSGMTLAFELDDAAAFEQSFDRMLRSRGLHVGRKTRDYRGVSVRSLNLFGMLELHYTFGDDLVMFGFGREPKGLDQLLDRLVARRQGEQPGPFPEPVAERLESMPSGWQTVSVTDVRSLLDAFAGGFEGAMMEMPRDAQPILVEMRKWVSTVGRLVERYDLELMVATSHFTKDRFVSRMVW